MLAARPWLPSRGISRSAERLCCGSAARSTSHQPSPRRGTARTSRCIETSCSSARCLWTNIAAAAALSSSSTRQQGHGKQLRRVKAHSSWRAADSDGVGEYISTLTSKVRGLASDVKSFVPEKAYEVMGSEERDRISAYVKRYADLLLLEVDEEVKEFVATLKDWSLEWLKQDGRVLLGLTGAPAGEYFGDQVLRFFVPEEKPGNSSRDEDQGLQVLPRHSLAPGDMVLLTSSKQGPLVGGGWDEGTMYGVVTERSSYWIKVAFETGPDKGELQICDTWRIDKSVNTLTAERALLGLVALWNRIPFSTSTWSSDSLLGIQTTPDNPLKSDVDKFFGAFFEQASHRRHMGVLEGTSLADVIISADESFDWSSLPVEAGGMAQEAIRAARKMLPMAGRPDMAATAAMLRQLEEQGALASSAHSVRLDASQMHAISTALLNPLTLLHGPPGTGKTTTIGGLLHLLRRSFGFKGKILAAAQSNVAVDNMLETAMRRGLRVLRIGEPVKVRSSLQRFTLRAQIEVAVAKDTTIAEARAEQKSLRQQLRGMRRKARSRSSGYERQLLYERLDELNMLIDKEVKRLTQQLLAAADVVGVTCTGAAGPELADAAFDMVVIDEGSQASEPEALIPLMKGCRRVVLVGDHKQLPPVVKSSEAAAGGLGQSLFERLMGLGAPSAMLQVQYRSHPALMDFVNQQFYCGLLSNGVAAADRPAPAGFPFPAPSVPIVFVAVDGQEKSNARGSKLNEQEAAVVVACVTMLVQSCGLAPGLLGVISPYAAQVSLLSKQLQERGYTINARGGSSDQEDAGRVPDELEVKSVDGYQGREKEVILLSTVRANGQQQVGFVDDWRRANVALSRARTALVVIGHRSTLRGSETWSAFLEHVTQQGCLVKQEQLQLQLRTGRKLR